MADFERLAGGATPEPQPTFLERGRDPWQIWADYCREAEFIVLNPYGSVALQVPSLGSKL